MESNGLLAAITSASTFLASQQRIVAPEQLVSTHRSMTASLVLQVNQISELSSDDATMLTDAIDASFFDAASKTALAAAVGAKMAAVGHRSAAGPKGQVCIHIKDYTTWHCHSAPVMRVCAHTYIYCIYTHTRCGIQSRTLLPSCV